MKNEVNRALAAEKKQYIYPNTTTVAFHAGLICAGSSTDPSLNVGGGTLGGGGEAPGGGSTIDPL
jgi:hypothetical protein